MTLSRLTLSCSLLSILALVGCGAPELGGAAEVQAADTSSPPPPAPGSVCFSVLGYAQADDDPWAAIGQTGYVVSNPLSWPTNSGLYGVLGFDATMTNVLWKRTAASPADVTHYQQLPGTLPFTCPYNCSAGQVSSGGTTNTGGTGFPPGEVCFLQSDLSTLQKRTEAALCGTRSCGTVVDGCGNQISCGTCSYGYSCDATNACVCTRVCGRGYYLDSDSCTCKFGLPQ